MNQVKILYRDADKVRVLKGVITNEDTTFITISCEFNDYRLNKESIISIKQEKKLEAKKDANTRTTD